MKETLLSYLACPTCGHDYSLRADLRDGEEILQGKLICSCSEKPILNGVPRLLPQEIDSRNWKTASRFGEEWNQFDMLTDKYKEQFLSWIKPIEESFFKDKLVLDVGCGKGRHILHSKNFGAREVIGIDLSHAVDAAYRNIGNVPGVHIIQADIYQLPLKPIFDYAYSIGVLHHTPDPEKSFHCMVGKVRPGGSVSAWVYGREGNDWIIYILNPIRRITSKLPLPITKALAFILSVILQSILLVLYKPARSHLWLQKILPYSAYLCSISEFSFKENYSIVFDHLLPEIAFYIPKQDFEQWFKNSKLGNVVITQRNKNSWRGYGIKS